MTAFRYARSRIPIRRDIPRAHRRAWEQIARPGTWWTGAQRVAIAAEVRRSADCALCAERKQALSPEAVDGLHDRASELPEAAVEVIHRVTTDPGRLSRRWIEGILASGLSDAQYVELIGVLVRVVSIDQFHRALGFALEPLPRPRSGKPSMRRPPGAPV